MSDKNLVPVTGDTWATIKAIAPVAQASRMFGITIEQAAIVMLKGHELGLGLAGAFEFIHVIDGKPSLSPKGMMALIHNDGRIEVKLTRLVDKSGKFEGYECWMKRKDTGFEHSARFTLQDAVKAGLMKDKSSWEKYPENMCQWRAIGFAGDVVCPDVGGGMLRPEELGAEVDAEGTPVVIASWHVVEEKPQPQSAKIETPAANSQPVVSEVAKPEKPVEPVKAPEAVKEPEKAKEPELVKEPEAPTTTIPDNLTVADLLSRGYGVADLQTAIQALQAEGMTVHFPPATSEECAKVLERLQANA